MKTLLTITQQDIDPASPKIDISNFRTRETARAVLLDDKGRVYLMNVTLYGYHKLPGGGIDEGEDTLQALERELMEEVGCHAEVVADIGVIVECRDFETQKQTSYCYLAKQLGQQESSSLEEGEIAEGMIEFKAKNIDEAIALLESDRPDNIEGRFIQKRDLTFLTEAKKVLQK